MANELKCVPDDVELRCGAATTVRVKTSPRTGGIKITALGYDDTVASVSPTEGTTNSEGYLQVKIRCAQERLCPGSTTVTFDADGYEDDTLDIECVSFPPPPVPAPAPPADGTARVAFVEVSLRELPALLSKYVGLPSTMVSTALAKESEET